MDGLRERKWREETQREVLLSLYAIKYPDTLLIESLTDKARSDIRRLSAYLHFAHHTYSIWDEDTVKGLSRLGIVIPSVKHADPFVYGAYISSIELLKDGAFHMLPEHDVPYKGCSSPHLQHLEEKLSTPIAGGILRGS